MSEKLSLRQGGVFLSMQINLIRFFGQKVLHEQGQCGGGIGNGAAGG